jgi:hypothetical protein
MWYHQLVCEYLIAPTDVISRQYQHHHYSVTKTVESAILSIQRNPYRETSRNIELVLNVVVV